MTYAAAISIILIAGIVAAVATAFLQHLIEFDLRRHHHDVGSVVFLQLGVVFAVLLAFVFNEVWSEYNEAAQSIDQGVQNIEYKPLHTNIPTCHQILLQQFGRVTHGKHQVLISPSMTLASTAAMKDD